MYSESEDIDLNVEEISDDENFRGMTPAQKRKARAGKQEKIQMKELKEFGLGNKEVAEGQVSVNDSAIDEGEGAKAG